MERKLITSLLVIVTFLLADSGVSYFSFSGERDSLAYLGFTFSNRLFWFVLLPLLVLMLLYPARQVLAEVGLNCQFVAAAKISLIATLPMLLGYGFAAGFRVNLSLDAFLLGALLAGFAEEVYFRGFLFGQLFRRVGLWFLPAAAVSALFFGIGHLYQGNGLLETVGVFLITLVGGVWFSWLFVRWDFNLWVPIGFHFLMNLYWSAFEAGNTALEGIEANVYRALTVGLSIWLTLRWTQKQKQDDLVSEQSIAN